MNNGWTLDKLMTSVSTCHLVILPRMAIVLNMFKSDYIIFKSGKILLNLLKSGSVTQITHGKSV